MRDYLRTPARQAATVEETRHRPWPIPATRWVQAQTWEHLLFAHWPVDAGRLARLLPPGLEVDTHGGAAWLGITPFRLRNLRVRGTLPLPRLSSFLELNVRTYVTVEGRPGIWFFSLDCESPVAVEAARRLYRLPYYRARMGLRRSGEELAFTSARSERAARPYVFEASYRPAGEAREPEPGSLERFLVERYCLYTLDERQDLARAEIHHPPWRLRDADATIDLNTMAPDAVPLPAGEPPLCHLAEPQDVVLWPLEPV